MANIRNVLCNLLTKEGYICRLCFKELDGNLITHIQDEVTLNKDMVNITISEILNELLTETVSVKIDSDGSMLDTICEQCTKSAIEAYKFIAVCRNSTEYLQNLIKNFTNCLVESTDTFCMARAIYVSVENSTCEAVCDFRQPAYNSDQALKRYKNICKIKQRKINADSDITYKHDKNKIYKRRNHNYVADEIGSSTESATCEICLKKFSTKHHMKAHYIRVHAPKKFFCTECPRRFGSAYLLKLHLSESHIQVICAECGKTYNNVHSLKLHEMSCHQAKMLCHSCGKYYKNRKSYKRHINLNICARDMDMEHRVRCFPKYTCDVCHKSFSQKGALRVHITFEHGNAKAYICPWCGKRFPAHSRLQAHIVKHTKEKNFTCDICGGKFVTKESLLYHTRIHTGEKPYACSYCDQRFLSASRRMEHLRRKHLGPTLVCEICSSRFKTPYCLKKHMKRHLNPHSRLFNDSGQSNCVEV